MASSGALKALLHDIIEGVNLGEAYLLRQEGRVNHAVIAYLPALPERQYFQGWLLQLTLRVKILLTGT